MEGSVQILLIDNYDSFTYMLKDYIEQCGGVCHVIRNDDENLFAAAAVSDAIVLSPGPQKPSDAGRLMDITEAYAGKKPILGVCLGHQAIGLMYGASLVKAHLPKHGKVEQISHNGSSLFSHIPETFEATRYHSLLLEDIPACIEITAVSKTAEVMGIAHKSLPVWGIQFHPESCTTAFGHQLIKNFLHLAELSL